MRPLRNVIPVASFSGTVLMFAVIAPQIAGAQSEPIFNIPFRNIPFQTPAFSGFAFKTPGFATPNGTTIPFQNIRFRGVYGPAEPGRRRDRRDRDSQRAGGDFRFPLRSRPDHDRIAAAKVPNVRLARRDPFSPVSPGPYYDTRFARSGSSLQSRMTAHRREEPAVTRLQLAADRHPFSPARR